jgi:hypothetical protein
MMVMQTSSAFTTQTLERLAQAASLSYLSLDKMPSSPYFEKSRLQPLLQVVDPVSESGATIFVDTSAAADADSSSSIRRRLVVACRGSANPKNFGTNLKFKLVPADRLSQTKIPDNAMIHEGFQDASVGLWRRLGPQLLDVLSKNQKSTTSSTSSTEAPFTEVVFTGHSLGAATALLCAVHYSSTVKHQRQQQQPDKNSVSVITFGGPKLANGVLARHLRNDALDGSTILHLVHDKDPVLANNQKLWNQLGFEDVGIELNCAPKAPIVYTTDALDETKKKKSFLFGKFAWNLMDHCNYMGVFVGPRL